MKVRMWLCTHSDGYSEDQDAAPSYVFRIGKYDTDEEWDEMLYGNFAGFGFSRDTHQLSVHESDVCDRGQDHIELRDIKEGGRLREKLEKTKEPSLEAHFSELEQDLGLIVRKGTATKGEHDPVRYIRFGRVPDDDQPDTGNVDWDEAELESFGATLRYETRLQPGATAEEQDPVVPIRAIGVGKVDTSLKVDDRAMEFMIVWTYVLNGVRLGDCEHGDLIPIAEQGDLDIKDDPYFARKNNSGPGSEKARHRKRRVLAYVADESRPEPQAETPRYLLDWQLRVPKNEARSARDIRVPIALPVCPKSTRAKFPGKLKGFPKRPMNFLFQEVVVVAVFENRLSTTHNLRLPAGLEVHFPSSATYKDVCEYFVEGRSEEDEDEEEAVYDYKGLVRERKLQAFESEWEVELWVIPQVKQCSTFYRWTGQVEHLQLGAFVQPGTVRTGHPGVLMVSIDIVPKEVAEPQVAVDVTREKSKKRKRTSSSANKRGVAKAAKTRHK